jgi:hypothetical protein
MQIHLASRHPLYIETRRPGLDGHRPAVRLMETKSDSSLLPGTIFQRCVF